MYIPKRLSIRLDRPPGHTETDCPQRRGQPVGRRPFGLFGQDHLSAEALVLGSQGAEVDTASTTAPLGVLPVPRQVVVHGLLVSIRQRRDDLARNVETGQIVSGESGSKHQQVRISLLDELNARNWGSVPLFPLAS
jgi:hypothetical protein